MELLVVVVIIIALAALSLMGIDRFRKAGDKAVAIRNISQLHIANTGWAADHNGRYVSVYAFDQDKKQLPQANWHANASFLGYLNGEGVTVKSKTNEPSVPLSMLDPVVVRAKKFQHDSYQASYGYNHEGIEGNRWGDPSVDRSFFVHQIVSPERSCAFISCTDWIAKYSGRYLWTGSGATEGKTPDGKIAFRHGGKALVVYYDGHVGEVSANDLKKFDSATPSGDKSIFWNADGK